jgi:hypothetical protein
VEYILVLCPPATWPFHTLYLLNISIAVSFAYQGGQSTLVSFVHLIDTFHKTIIHFWSTNLHVSASITVKQRFDIDLPTSILVDPSKSHSR